jgi:putative NADH-flavin reductase
MALAVFGGTGRTGQKLVEQALAAEHSVAVLARTPSKLAVTDERLRVVQGDALDPASVTEVITGADAVISLLGPEKDAPPQSVSRSTANLLRAAQACGTRRVIVAAGAGVGDPEDKPGLFDKAISLALRTAARGAYEDMRATAELVRASELDWTLVRIPMLTDGPGTGQPKVGYLGKGAGSRLSRSDLAAFVLAQLDDRAFLRKAPVIST